MIPSLVFVYLLGIELGSVVRGDLSGRNEQSPTRCLYRCKSAHMREMRLILGSDADETSSKFLRPLHTIFMSANSEREAFSKLNAACKSNRDYHHCLSRCQDSLDRHTLIIGLKPQAFICRSWKNGELYENAPCLYANIKELDRRCEPHLENLKSVFHSITQPDNASKFLEILNTVCRASTSYDLCYGDAVKYYCGKSAVLFWKELSDISNRTILELFARIASPLELPEDCLQEAADGRSITGGNSALKNPSSARSLRDDDLSVDGMWGGANPTFLGLQFGFFCYLFAIGSYISGSALLI